MENAKTTRRLVYVVEDEEEQLALLRFILAEAQYDVVTESNADRVLKGVRDLQPDVVLLDVMLPSETGTDGFQLCQEIKRMKDIKPPIVILVSAIAQGVGTLRDKVRTEVGADDYFVKPYDPSALIARMKQFLG